MVLLAMIPTSNTSLGMPPTVLMRVMIQFMNDNNGDLGGHGIWSEIQVILKSVAIVIIHSLSLLIYHLFAVIGPKLYSVRYSKKLHST
ncbi:uncharacterized protein CYBJADRAFT_73397 [Cyberlindnera jadinii NRRL Y-1542]|uniref:Uncharacterized protein n=1 Tax=Cyberlindnera jadinii (strain ATCC 18201 / CBS 1600 / BCRC 20928 / JCM 3617 / NBRC 0987 / NRRL Y-1542) TaxID=983966 RepID=A0A1E4S4G7_CYBJN|nr:hypothetical protein CYBJADRAFT_73397 [Cyberlindnera jadinii NRRL Y-1542]ODV74427.1 hypothetical protein CYBJADRAFT_73397 [Cyberlindnera jadinii NRRL Y-1542]